MKKFIAFIFLNAVVLVSIAQEGTRTTQTKAPEVVGKILIVPFEPKLYMSEIDQKVNQQTNWKFEKIREHFRQQLNDQLKLKLKSIAPVVSFYSDSAKMAKDLLYLYKSTTLAYDLVQGQNTKIQKQEAIKNGQLTVEANTDKKFMNTKATDVQAFDYFNKKYKTNYFVFINQLDIVNDPDSYDLTTDMYQRNVTVHYSILDNTGKNILSGVAISHFSSKENEPKKIVALSFAPIATEITARFLAFVKPEPVTSNKK